MDFKKANMPVAAVSYTHLDVYKRQVQRKAGTPAEILFLCVLSGPSADSLGGRKFCAAGAAVERFFPDISGGAAVKDGFSA